MLAGYGLVALFLIVAIFFTLTMIGIPIFLRLIGVVPKNPSAAKNAIFECGMETIGTSRVKFNIRYYFYALLFIALDVLVIFLYPWAVGLRELGFFGLAAVFIFLAIILVGYVYAWRKKVLEWK